MFTISLAFVELTGAQVETLFALACVCVFLVEVAQNVSSYYVCFLNKLYARHVTN